LAKLLTKIAIDNVLKRLNRATELEMVATTDWLSLNLQVHLKVDEKVDILLCFEWKKGAKRAH